MTNKEIIAKIEAAGHQVPGGLNRAKLEALAAEKGVSLKEEKPAEEDGSGTTADGVVPRAEAYDPGRIITPVMAVCAISGDAAAVPENGQGESPEDS